MHRSHFGRSDRSTCANDGGHRTSSSSDRSTCDGGGGHRNTSSSEQAPTLVAECISPSPAMISQSAPVVGHITLAPAVSATPFSCGGVNRTCSRHGSSTCAWSGGHRGSTCRDRSTRASDYRVCGASTRRVRSTSASGNVHLPMSAVLVAPAPSVCAAPAPVAEHVSRCLPCSWREHMPCAMRLRQWWSIAETQRRCGVTPFLLLMRQQRHALQLEG